MSFRQVSSQLARIFPHPPRDKAIEPNRFGPTFRAARLEQPGMSGFLSRFGGSNDSGELFDEYGEFVVDHIPSSGAFLDGHEVLSGRDHVAFHETIKNVFQGRGVYDVTFRYNLARLNLDSRHPDAGYRYAEEVGEPIGATGRVHAHDTVLSAE